MSPSGSAPQAAPVVSTAGLGPTTTPAAPGAAAGAPLASRAALASAVALAFFIPLGIAAANLFAALLVAAWFAMPRRLERARAALREPVVLAALGLWALIWAGTLWSPAGPLSDEALRHAFGYRKLLLIPFVASVCDTRERRAWVLGAFVAGVAASNLVTLAALLFNAYGGPWLKRGVPFFLKNYIAESFCSALAMYACALFAAAARTPHGRFALAALALLFGLHVLLVLPGRTGYLVLFALLLLLVLQLRLRPRALVAALAALAVMIAAAWQSPAFRDNLQGSVLAACAATGACPPEVLRRHLPAADGDALSLDSQRAATSLELRVEFWRNGWHLWETAPLFGHGTGSVPILYRELLRADPEAGSVWTGNLHSQYLQFGAELGLLGLAGFLVLLATAASRARRLPEPEAALAAGVLVALAIGCLFNSFLLDATEGHAVPLLLGALCGSLLAGRERSDAPDPGT